MKRVLSLLFIGLCVGASAQAEPVQRFVGEHVQYNDWTAATNKDVYTCYASIKNLSNGYEVLISFGRKDLKSIEGQKFVFLNSQIEHPASNAIYAGVPVNFSQNKYYAYSEVQGLGRLRMALIKTSDGLKLDRSEGLLFKAENKSEEKGNFHCMSLRNLNSY